MAENGRSYFDRQEVRDPHEREQSIFHALPGLIRHAIDNAPFFREQLAGIEPDTITSRAALADLPLLHKAALGACHRPGSPFGGLAATATGRLTHLYAADGPLYGLEGGRSDYWRFARAMYAAGFRRGDIILNTFDYHLVPDGFMADLGARAMGCPVVPAGAGDLDRLVHVMADLAPVGFVGRPSVLRALLERATELGVRTVPLRKALLAFEPFTVADALAVAEAWGIVALQCHATRDLGLIAYQSGIGDGFIVDEAMIVEIVDPATGRPVAPCQSGELVVTAFNPDFPMIRFATGDLTEQLPGESPCGRTNMRLAGVLGRVPAANPRDLR